MTALNHTWKILFIFSFLTGISSLQLHLTADQANANSLTPVNISTFPSVAKAFTAVYSDPNGWLNLSDVSLFLSGSTHNEWVHYNPQTNKFTLVGVGGDCSPGQATILSNTQLILNCGPSTASGSGSDLTVTYNLTPQPSFSGASYLLIITAVDQSSARNSMTAGFWTVNLPPSADKVSPMSSITDSGMDQTFTAVASDPDGWQTIAAASVYFSGNGGVHNEWLHYLDAPNWFTMMGTDDVCSPGQMKTLSNGYLTLDCSSSSVSGSGTELTVIFQVTPQMPSSGLMYDIFISASDNSCGGGGSYAGTWQIQ
jgi:hypothetical protein